MSDGIMLKMSTVFCTGFPKIVFPFVGTACLISTDVLDCWKVNLKKVSTYFIGGRSIL